VTSLQLSLKIKSTYLYVILALSLVHFPLYAQEINEDQIKLYAVTNRYENSKKLQLNIYILNFSTEQISLKSLIVNSGTYQLVQTDLNEPLLSGGSKVISHTLDVYKEYHLNLNWYFKEQNYSSTFEILSGTFW